MDCVVVQTRVAAFIDGELAPAEAEQFALHIERCGVCAQVVIQMEAQAFMPLTAREKEAVCGSPDFWSDMELGLCEELDAVAASCGTVKPWYARQVGLPMPMVAMYAAAMLLAIAWGLQQQERAEMAEVSAEHLGKQLEEERRVVVQPPASEARPRKGTYKVVNYTPQSGTF